MNLKYRPDIDGLRALAIIAVIIYHLNNSWLSGGFVGVDIFFVISGYLITQIIYTDIIQQQFSFKHFYQRRINRILPVFFIVMFCISIAAWYILLPDQFTFFLKSLKTTTYFGENIFFAQNTGGYWDIKAETTPILHTWSLAVEEQFYIFFPVILIFITKIYAASKNNKIIKIISLLFVLTIISFTLAQLSPYWVLLTKFNYYSLFTGRAGELLIGSITGLLSSTIKNNKHLDQVTTQEDKLRQANLFNFIGFIGVILSFILFSKHLLFPSFWAVIPTISVALILFFYHPNSYITKLLSLFPFVYIGKISYSLYLWHWPIFVLGRKYLFIDNFINFKQYIIVVSATIILSIFTYHFVETPCRKYKSSFKFSVIMYYFLPSLIIISLFYIQKDNIFNNVQSQNTLKIYKLMKTKHWEINTEGFCYNIGKECIFGDTSKKPEIVAFGNSHMEHMFRYLNQAGKMYGFSIRMIGSGGCSYMDGFIGDQRCSQIKPQIDKWIKESRIIIYTVNFWGQNNKAEWKNGKTFKDIFPIFLDKMLQQNKTVIILQDIPDLNSQEVEKFFYNYLNNKKSIRYDFFTHKEIAGNEMIKQIIQGKGPNIIFFNLLTGLSTNEIDDWPFYKGIFAYADSNHLNAYTAKEFPKEVLPKQKYFWEKIAEKANQ